MQTSLPGGGVSPGFSWVRFLQAPGPRSPAPRPPVWPRGVKALSLGPQVARTGVLPTESPRLGLRGLMRLASGHFQKPSPRPCSGRVAPTTTPWQESDPVPWQGRAEREPTKPTPQAGLRVCPEVLRGQGPPAAGDPRGRRRPALPQGARAKRRGAAPGGAGRWAGLPAPPGALRAA